MSSIPPYPGSDSAGRPENGSSANPGAWSAPQQAQGSPEQYGQASPYGQPSPFEQPSPQGQQASYGQQPQSAQQAPDGAAHGMGAAPATTAPRDLGSDLGTTLTWMWQAFARNVAAFLIPAIVWGVIAAVIAGGVLIVALVAVYIPMLSAADGGGQPDEAAVTGAMVVFLGLTVLAALLAGLTSLFWQSGAARAAAAVLEGRRPSVGEGFIGAGRVLLTILLVGVLTAIGMMIFYIPGLIVAVACFYALPAAARGARPIEAIKQSFSTVRANLGVTIIAYLITMVAASLLGFIIIGSVLLVPLLVLWQFALFERLNGRDLPEPVRA